jgi:hypothetical protein
MICSAIRVYSRLDDFFAIYFTFHSYNWDSLLFSREVIHTHNLDSKESYFTLCHHPLHSLWNYAQRGLELIRQ